MGVYVDDLVITGGSSSDINKFKSQMKGTFQMSNLSLLHYYLGLEVHQSADGITLGQSAMLLCSEDSAERRAGRLQIPAAFPWNLV